ncbi:unnamed protein product [Bursaphelenchus okinawaensis]|uniref:Uncharacterized protein n=1 Tax=Bursaphelenchus okinawaensis TaxID=465554 RepID=A0A811JVY7_9BILA|nr:unnamed protein product [Bursaphelenchus okinawaensis]CAG9084904.1 unnamed protein product [Bursaphelenchus okinawaensis]
MNMNGSSSDEELACSGVLKTPERPLRRSQRIAGTLNAPLRLSESSNASLEEPGSITVSRPSSVCSESSQASSSDGIGNCLTAETPIVPFKDVVRFVRQQYHGNTPRRSKSPSRTLRRSLRNAAGPSSSFLDDLPKAESGFNAKIRQQMTYYTTYDQRKLRKELAVKGQGKSTPEGLKKPVYDLMNPASVDRKFVDDLAEMHLENGTEPGEPEVATAEGSQYLQRQLFNKL